MPNTIHSGEGLGQDQQLISNNNAYRAGIQSHGNFVLYNYTHTVAQNAIWSSNTCNRHPFVEPYRLAMQHDANLAIYDGYNRAVWASNTQYRGIPPHRLVMQDDGNLVLYDLLNQPKWASGTTVRFVVTTRFCVTHEMIVEVLHI